MHYLALATSTALQSIYLLGLSELFLTAFRFNHIRALYEQQDSSVTAGFIASNILEFGVCVFLGLVGVAIAWRVLQKTDYQPGWFLFVSKIFAWAWILFIPIGTVIGISMLRWQQLRETPTNSQVVSALSTQEQQ